MNVLEWIDLGVAQGWCSEPVCSTHDGIPMTDVEEQEVEEGWDPCLFVLRLHEAT